MLPPAHSALTASARALRLYTVPFALHLPASPAASCVVPAAASAVAPAAACARPSTASPKEAPREIRPGAVGGAAAGSGGVYDGPSPPCVPPCVPSRAALLREKALTSCCFHDAPRASCGA